MGEKQPLLGLLARAAIDGISDRNSEGATLAQPWSMAATMIAIAPKSLLMASLAPLMVNPSNFHILI